MVGWGDRGETEEGSVGDIALLPPCCVASLGFSFCEARRSICNVLATCLRPMAKTTLFCGDQ